MASSKIPGPICHSRNPSSIRDGTLERTATPNPAPIGCDDPFPPARGALDLAQGFSVLAGDHVDKVEQVINWAIEEGTKRYREPRTGAVTGTRFQILVRALQILARYRNANEPTSLVYRDADHYLSARVTEPQLHYRKDASGAVVASAEGFPDVIEERPHPIKSYLLPVTAEGYEFAKGLGFLYEAAAEELLRAAGVPPLFARVDHPLQYGSSEPTQVGGLEWVQLGYEHLRTLDDGHWTEKKPPPPLGPVSLEQLRSFQRGSVPAAVQRGL
jgi:hypothetical protein